MDCFHIGLGLASVTAMLAATLAIVLINQQLRQPIQTNMKDLE